MPSSFSSGVPPPSKKKRQATPKAKVYSRNVVCLPPAEDITKLIAIPHGETRARLTEAGLTGKIAISSTWNALEVQREISTMFASSFFFQDDELLPYGYLR